MAGCCFVPPRPAAGTRRRRCSSHQKTARARSRKSKLCTLLCYMLLIQQTTGARLEVPRHYGMFSSNKSLTQTGQSMTNRTSACSSFYRVGNEQIKLTKYGSSGPLEGNQGLLLMTVFLFFNVIKCNQTFVYVTPLKAKEH